MCIGAGLFKYTIGDLPSFLTRAVGGAFMLLSLMFFMGLSYIDVPEGKFATLHKIYGATSLKNGRIIAVNGEKGPQGELYPEGFHFSPAINLLYDVEYHDLINIPAGKYGILVAKDGAPLREDQFIADEWPENTFAEMLDPKYFLESGGQKGPQMNVLRPGKHRINPKLWDIQISDFLDVPTGTVAVIRSNVQTETDEICDKTPEIIDGIEQEDLPIVPVGCIGVWDTPLEPGKYYLNNMAYNATLIPTRLTTWIYAGGYTKRWVDLVAEEDGSISQTQGSELIPLPNGAAGEAITVRVEGWEFPIEVRAVVKVDVQNAPIVVATIGDLQKVEDRIITPAISDIMRTIGGEEGRDAMDFVNKREQLMEKAEGVVRAEASKAGVTLEELRLGEAVIPPELMVATRREQLAKQLKATFIEEEKTQQKRIAVEAKKAEANQQGELMKAQIAKQAAKDYADRDREQGAGERDRLMAIAEGQKAQAGVLGEDRVVQLEIAKMTIEAAKANPSIVKVPVVLVQGSEGGGGLDSMAAILGASNLTQQVGSQQLKSKTE